MRTSDAPRAAPTEVAAGNPFPGPRPFAEEEADVFFGREREIEHLLALLIVERAVLVHAPSGSGKSSLVNAGVIPRARDRGFQPLPVARVRDPLGSRRRETTSRYVANVLENWRDDPYLASVPEATTLVDFLAALGPASEPGRVMILDQFEEIFLYPESWRDRADLFRQVQRALDRDPLLRVLFILRDDYLARLEPFTPLLRDRLRARYRIAGLEASQALSATVEPFEKAGLRFAPGAADVLVKGLLLQPQEDPDAPRYEGEHVEPVQLQIVCRTLFDRLAERAPTVDVITQGDVERYANVDQALAGFYDEAVTAATSSTRHLNERQVRLWFERRLITPSRARNRVLREAERTGGLPNDVVDQLEQRRVVHAEARGPDRWYELTHDRFVDAVLSSNRAWFTSSKGRDRRGLLWPVLLGLLAVVGIGLAFLVREGGGGSDEEIVKYAQIDSADRAVPFEVDGKAGQLVTAQLRSDGDLRGHLELQSPTGTLVASSADSPTSGALLTARLTETGLYRLIASGRDGTTGTFNVSIRLETVDVADRAIQPPTDLEGTIGVPDEVDLYTFEGAKDAVVRISMTAGGLDSGLVLVAPSGSGFYDDDGGGAGNAALALLLPETGTYSVRASSTGSSTGAYRLGLEFLEGEPLVREAGGEVDARRPVQVHLVRSPQGGLGVFRLVPDPGFDASLRLVLADATVLDDTNEEGTGGAETLVEPIVPDATYLLLVASSDPAAGGSYSLALTLQPLVALSDATVSGDVAAGERGDVYLLNADGPQVATISVRADPPLAVRVDVLGPDGGPVTTAQEASDGEDVAFAVRLPARGPYVVAVSPTSPDHRVGTYSLGVSRVPGRSRSS